MNPRGQFRLDRRVWLNRRFQAYLVLGVVLAVGTFLLRTADWEGFWPLNTLLETLGTLLAFATGGLGLVRFYKKKDLVFLFLGTGFLGTAVLNGYFDLYFPLALPGVPHLGQSPPVTWVWAAPPLFLSGVMAAGWIALLRQPVPARATARFERGVFAGAAAWGVAGFLFFSLFPLPPAFLGTPGLPRPEALVPALLFLIAFCGFFLRGRWLEKNFSHWMLLSLFFNFFAHAGAMVHSVEPNDAATLLARLLENLGYLCALVGLLVDTFEVFQQMAETSERLAAVVDNIVDGVITINDRGVIQSINKATVQIFGYRPEELVGKNIRVLAAEPYRGSHDQYLSNYLRTGDPKVIGNTREVVGERRNGSPFPLELTVTELWLGEERLFLGIVRDITERKEMERMKGEFISTVSHELRTPLTSIRGALGMVATGALGTMTEPMEKMVSIAKNNCERLVGLVNDILDFEKLSSGALEIHSAPVDLVELVQQAIEANRPFCQERKVALELEPGPGRAAVVGDANRLLQVLTNLISNAAKFSPANATVALRVQEMKHGFRVSVADRGPGIPVEFRPRLFDRFSQADGSDSRSRGGTGLGLNISKAIIDRHGGNIGFETEVGHGATFYFDLPDLWHQHAAVPAAPGNGSPSVTPPPKAPPRETPGRILVWADQASLADSLAKRLAQSGVETKTAHSVRGAQERLAGEAFDAIAFDLEPPPGAGNPILETLSLVEGSRGVPVLMMPPDSGLLKGKGGRRAVGVVGWPGNPAELAGLVTVVTAAGIGVVGWPDNAAELARPVSVVTAAANGAPEKPRVLYVEDDSDLVEVMMSTMEKETAVRAVKTMAEAEAALHRERFDLIILDAGLPDGVGLDLLPGLRETRNAETPVVLLSAHSFGPHVNRQFEQVLVKSQTSEKEVLAVVKKLAKKPLRENGKAPHGT